MDTIRGRAAEASPAMYMTVTGMIVAIAIETLVGRLQNVGLSLSVTPRNLVIWLQALEVLQIAVGLWVSYVTLTSLARWVLGWVDFYVPFLMGVILFAAIGVVGNADGYVWFYLVATGMLAGTGIFFRNIARAAADPQNMFFTEARPRRITAGLIASSGFVALLGGLGQQLGIGGDWAAVSLLITGNLLVGSMTAMFIRWWLHATREPAAV
jgi:hypothetical protein